MVMYTIIKIQNHIILTLQFRYIFFRFRFSSPEIIKRFSLVKVGILYVYYLLILIFQVGVYNIR